MPKKALPDLVSAAMNALPEDVVVVILRKLAEQDPISLLQASTACKSLLKVSSIVWREAFLAPFDVDENALGLEESQSQVEDKVASLGEYKRLAIVKGRYRRASKQHVSNLNKHPEKHPTTEIVKGYGSITPPPEIVARYLFVYKVRGETLAGTFDAPTCSSLGSSDYFLRFEGADGNSRVYVAAFLTKAGKQLLGDKYERMLEEWTDASKVTVPENKNVGRRMMNGVLNESVSDLEVFAALDLHINPEGRGCKPWTFPLSIGTKRSVYTFPSCKGNVHLVFPDRNLSQ